jgi:predicted PurR-regulated permease PerM
LGLGTLLLSILFSYYAISKMDFLKPRGKWLAIVIFLLLVAGMAYGLASLIKASVEDLPAIADKALPDITQWAAANHIRLPFTDMEGLKVQAGNMVRTQVGNIGRFADFARGATTEFIYLTVGCMVAVGLFLNPHLDLSVSPGRPNLYSLSCVEITRRFSTFYRSFEMTMNAQVLISAINTALTAVFMLSLRLPHLGVALGITFIAGLVPVVGNLIGSVMLVAIGFVVSPGDGLLALGFVAVLHYVGFVLSSKIIGAKIESSFWLTLVALVVGESLLGVTGMVLAPAALHYIRMEASQIPVKTVHHPRPS